MTHDIMITCLKTLQLYYCGGKLATDNTALTVDCQRLENGTWKKSTPMKRALYKHTCTSLNDYGIVCGGKGKEV